MLNRYKPLRANFNAGIFTGMVYLEMFLISGENIMKYRCNKLSNATVKSAKPRDKKYKLADGAGLYCEVLVTGTKVWRYNYRINEKQKTLTIGKYPATTLSQARKQRNQASEYVSKKIDPCQKKKLEKNILSENIFQAVAETWLAERKGYWVETTHARVTRCLVKGAYPCLGQREIATITALEIIPVILNISNQGNVYSAKYLKRIMQQVFDYAVVYGKLPHNPVKDINLQLILPKITEKHYPIIKDPLILKQLLIEIDRYRGRIITQYALKIALRVMLRPGELLIAEWSEINFDTAIWTVPAKHRKLLAHLKKENRPEDAHIVPLSKQTLILFKTLYKQSGQGKYIFPSPKKNNQPIHINTPRNALRTMGLSKETITLHGFRGTVSTFLNAKGYRSDAIEAQLAHKDKNAIRAAYNHADYMEERRTMLQDWADYLDSL